MSPCVVPCMSMLASDIWCYCNWTRWISWHSVVKNMQHAWEIKTPTELCTTRSFSRDHFNTKSYLLIYNSVDGVVHVFVLQELVERLRHCHCVVRHVAWQCVPVFSRMQCLHLKTTWLRASRASKKYWRYVCTAMTHVVNLVRTVTVSCAQLCDVERCNCAYNPACISAYCSAPAYFGTTVLKKKNRIVRQHQWKICCLCIGIAYIYFDKFAFYL